MKKTLRQEMKVKRESLNKNEKSTLDNVIIERLINSNEYKESDVLFIFVSTEEEIDTLKLIEHSLKVGKTVAVPKVISKADGMKAIKIDSLKDLTSKGAFGILEPKDDKEEINEKIDLIVVPGLAFDRDGNRIGYGGGFYDRFIRINKSSKTIGICYSFQIVDTLESESFDEKIEKLITDKDSFKFK